MKSLSPETLKFYEAKGKDENKALIAIFVNFTIIGSNEILLSNASIIMFFCSAVMSFPFISSHI
jgi:hypothetical protein